MPRAKKPIDPLTGEPDLLGGSDHRSKAEQTLGVRLATARLKRLTIQNEKLSVEQRARAGELVELEAIKRDVLAANQMVKQHILAVIERENLPHEAKIRLKHNMVEALNELAYERSPATTPRA